MWGVFIIPETRDTVTHLIIDNNLSSLDKESFKQGLKLVIKERNGKKLNTIDCATIAMAFFECLLKMLLKTFHGDLIRGQITMDIVRQKWAEVNLPSTSQRQVYDKLKKLITRTPINLLKMS